MRFGAHIYLWIERWSDHELPLLDRARSLGLDAIEIAVGDDVELTPALLRKAAHDLGIQIVLSPGAAWPMECDISHDDPACRRKGVEWHQRWIDVAGECGAAAYTGAIYGHPGRVERRIPPSDEMKRTAENLRKLCEHAAARHLKIAIEPMSHFRTHLVNTPDQAMQLLKMVDHPGVQVLLDTYHLVTEIRDFAQAVRTVGQSLWGIHACENDRGVPGGGLIPWDSMFGAIRDLNLDPPIFFEGYNSSLGDFAFRRGMFHNVAPDGDDFVRRGIQFLSGLR